MISPKIRIQLVLNNNVKRGIIILCRSSEKNIPAVWANKVTGDLELMWTCYTPMHFSVHIMEHILQKQLVWPPANSIFSASENKGLSVNLARPEILKRQETKQEVVLCLHQSFPLTWLHFANYWDLQCYYFISMWAKNELFLRSRAYPFLEYNVTVTPIGEILSDRACQHNTMQKILHITMI